VKQSRLPPTREPTVSKDRPQFHGRLLHPIECGRPKPWNISNSRSTMTLHVVDTPVPFTHQGTTWALDIPTISPSHISIVYSAGNCGSRPKQIDLHLRQRLHLDAVTARPKRSPSTQASSRAPQVSGNASQRKWSSRREPGS